MNRSKRDFSDEERQMLSLVRPHLIQAHANVQAFARLSQAIETLRGGVLRATRKGRLQHATPQALLWLAEYFSPRLDGAILPPSLITWLKSAGGLAPQVPFVQTKNGSRLAIRAVPSAAEPITLLLEVRRAASPHDLRLLAISAREAEVLFWLSKAKTNYEIGVILGITTRTVRNHVDHLFRKLKVENRLGAAAAALEVLSKESNN
jgi:DNA-binding CsgD family transcriptional regulator